MRYYSDSKKVQQKVELPDILNSINILVKQISILLFVAIIRLFSTFFSQQNIKINKIHWHYTLGLFT